MNSKYLFVLVIGFALGWVANFKSRPSAEIKSPALAQVSGTCEAKPAAAAACDIPAPGAGKTSSKSARIEPRDPRLIKDDFDSAMSNDNLREATEILNELERLGAQSRAFLESKSRFLVRTRDYEKAREVLNRCVELFADSETCLVDKASTELQLGKLDEKEKAVLACLARSPNHPECRNMLAIVRMNQKRYTEAVSIYQELARTNGDYGFLMSDWILDNQMGFALEGAKRFSEAADFFDRSCRSGKNESACSKAEELRRL